MTCSRTIGEHSLPTRPMFKFYFLAQFSVDHLPLSVVSSPILSLHEFATFVYNEINRFVFVTTTYTFNSFASDQFSQLLLVVVLSVIYLFIFNYFIDIFVETLSVDAGNIVLIVAMHCCHFECYFKPDIKNRILRDGCESFSMSSSVFLLMSGTCIRHFVS